MGKPLDGLSDATTILLGKAQGWIDGFIRLVPNILVALVFMGVVWLVRRGVTSAVRRSLRHAGRPALANVGASLIGWMILILGFLVAVTIVLPSVRPGDLFAGLGVSSVAIGFAFKDILQNLLSGVLILLRQPFRIGDQIVVGEFEGTVEDIETRATLLKTYDGRRVVIPNSDIYTRSVVVNTAFDLRRSEYDIGIGASDDWERAMTLIVEAAAGCEGVEGEPAPEAIPVGLDESQNTVRLRWWTRSDRASVLHTNGRVIRAAYGALWDAGIDMPYPTQVVLLHDQTEETDGDRNRQREGWPAKKDAPRPARIADRDG